MVSLEAALDVALALVLEAALDEALPDPLEQPARAAPPATTALVAAAPLKKERLDRSFMFVPFSCILPLRRHFIPSGPRGPLVPYQRASPFCQRSSQFLIANMMAVRVANMTIITPMMANTSP